MKKNILGLFLTVGISGIASANEIINEHDIEKIDATNFLSIQYEVLSCTTSM
ncbi:hypothetical protein QGN23_02775 [Chryseobacterium gotjawalense]|uniref:Uncharacterized protein n=1 Tax=Chryseobacterium gotjawalense TaxID=3042315 RepID=A0ABY8RGB6_9FLAO|nr:hypothetical protein [Chryseobacterium sp. wdc7]WHF52208.1 hypothetical protein QGN23_02775 [Chryseobacterium sp. wdc7]